MDNNEILTFRIDSLSPESLPMGRLADYLKELSALYGSYEHVHFAKIAKGSVQLLARIDEPAAQAVKAQLRLVRSSTCATEAAKAYQALDRLLRSDNAVGTIFEASGNNILEFPGRTKPAFTPLTIFQTTTVDGVVIKIGGRDETIPVLLKAQEGDTIRGQVKGYALAKELAKHYLEAPIRVHGLGKWTRDETGWTLEQLSIQSWETLDVLPAHEVLSNLRKIERNEWAQHADPMVEWRKLRGTD